MVTPEKGMGRYRHHDNATGPEPGKNILQKTAIILHMLQHIGKQHQIHATELFRKQLPKLPFKNRTVHPLSRMPHRVRSDIYPGYLVIILKKTEIATGSAADFQQVVSLKRRDITAKNFKKNLTPPHKPPVTLFHCRMQGKLTDVHGGRLFPHVEFCETLQRRGNRRDRFYRRIFTDERTIQRNVAYKNIGDLVGIDQPPVVPNKQIAAER